MAAPTFVSASAIAADVDTNVQVTLGTHAADDLGLLLAWSRDANDVAFSIDQGWSEVHTWTTTEPLSSSNIRISLFKKLLTSASETNPTVTADEDVTVMYAMAAVYRGDGSGELEVRVVGTPASSNADPLTIPGITTLDPDSLVVVGYLYSNDNASAVDMTATDPATFTEHYAEDAAGANGSIAFAEGVRSTAGATGDITADLNATFTANKVNSGIAIAIAVQSEPAGATGSGAPVDTLTSVAAGTAIQKFVGTGAPVDSLTSVAAGTATQSTVPFCVGVGAQVAGSTNGATLSPAFPGGYSVVPDDFMLVVVSGNTDTPGANPTTPTGLTLRTAVEHEVGARDLRTVTYYRILQAGDSAPQFTIPTAWSGAAAGGMTAQIAIYRGVDPFTPFDAADVTHTFDTLANGQWQPTGITTVTADARVLSIVSTTRVSAVALHTANSFTLRAGGAAYDTSEGGELSFGLADFLKQAAGATTNPVWVTSPAETTPVANITCALRPASPPAPVEGSGDPVDTLTSVAAGTAVQKFVGTGAPVDTLTSVAAGTATHTHTASGAPVDTLTSVADGTATNTAPEPGSAIGTGSPVSTLTSVADGDASSVEDAMTGAGAVVDILVSIVSGTASQKFSGSGAPVDTLTSVAVGSGDQVAFEGATFVAASGPLFSTGDREIAWPGTNAVEEDSSIQADDVAFLFVITKNQTVPALQPGAADSAGDTSVFTAITGGEDGVGTAGNAAAIRIKPYWARATSHHMRSVLIPDPGAAVGALMIVLRDVIATGDPVDAVSVNLTSPDNTAFTFDGLTTTVNNGRVIGAVGLSFVGDQTGSGVTFTNADLATLTELVDSLTGTGPGGFGLAAFSGEKLDAGAVGTTDGTVSSSARAAAVLIAVKPVPPPTSSTGTAAITDTLTSVASGTAVHVENAGTGAPVSTLVSVASGTATQLADHTGTGAPVSTLVSDASGTATSTGVDQISASGAPVSTLVSDASGLCFTRPIITYPPHTPQPSDGGQVRRGPKRTYYVVPEEEPEQPKRKRRRRRRPQPAVEVVPLPDTPELPHFEPVTFDPMLWQHLMAQVRPEAPVVSPQQIAEEDEFLIRLLETV
jgi:hypothetical protein